MAYTTSYTYENILHMTRPSLSTAANEEAKGPLALRLVSDYIWKAFDWRATLGVLPPFYPTPLQQDYPLPADFAGLRRYCYLVDARPIVPRYFPLDTKSETEITNLTASRPTTVGHIVEKDRLRLFPAPSASYSAPFFFITGKYKKVPPVVDASTLGSLVWTEDKHLPLWLVGMPWAYSLLGGAPPERTATLEAALRRTINEMASDEASNTGPSVVAPEEPLDWDTQFTGTGNYVVFG